MGAAGVANLFNAARKVLCTTKSIILLIPPHSTLIWLVVWHIHVHVFMVCASGGDKSDLSLKSESDGSLAVCAYTMYMCTAYMYMH